MDLHDRKRMKSGTSYPSYELKPSKWKNRSLLASLEFAISGILVACKEERNMKKHLISSFFVLVFGCLLRVKAEEWLFLLWSMCFVLSFEIMNTAVEQVVDLASEGHFSMVAKKAKDLAAGAVLVASIFAFITALIIFLPKIWRAMGG